MTNAVYWFDGDFDADKYTIASVGEGYSPRLFDTVEDIQRRVAREEAILAEPQDFMEAYRAKYLTEIPF